MTSWTLSSKTSRFQGVTCSRTLSAWRHTTSSNLVRTMLSSGLTIFCLQYTPVLSMTFIRDENHHEFVLTFGQIQADMRDVAFYFKKKSGFPKLSDSGLADVLLGGEGLTITAHVVSADKDRSSVFKVKNVNVKVGTLKFSIRDSKHDLLYKTLRPLATGLVKKQLQKAIADAVTTGLEYVDGQLVGVRDRMSEAKASEDKSRTQVLQEVCSIARNLDDRMLITSAIDVPPQAGRGTICQVEDGRQGIALQDCVSSRLGAASSTRPPRGMGQPHTRAGRCCTPRKGLA